MIFSSTIPANVRCPVGVAEYLAGRFTYHGLGEWAALIGEGRVRVNGVRCGAGDTVKAGDAVAYEPAPFEEPDADLSYSIIYEDDWIIAVNKPANLLVHRAGKSFRNNLTYQLRHVHVPPYPGCHPVHRLDRDTSGVVLAAKDGRQAAAFGKLFNEGRIVKRYKAAVLGTPGIETPFVIDAALSEDKGGGHPFKFKVDAMGKPAVTVIDGVTKIADDYCLLSIRPLTGRTHQIRVHLASIGFPIAGDKVYGSRDGRFKRQALHCESLTFIHPHTNNLCVILADLPSDMTFSC